MQLAEPGENYPQDQDSGQTPVGQVTCPNCLVAMHRLVMKTVKGESELREAAYRCPRCDTQTKRWMKP